MTKTAPQIEKFLLQNSFKSEREFEVISVYCAHKYNIKLKTPKKYDELDGLDYPTFSNWLDNGFAQGETVIHNGQICILSKAGNKFATIGCRVSQDLTAELDLSEEVSVSDLKKAAEQDVKNANVSLKRLGLELNSSALVIAEKYIPSNNELVKFWNDDVEGYGVVRVVSGEEVIMYCYFTLSEDLHYSMNESLGNVNDYSFEPMTLGYRRRLDTELRKVGKKWNQYSKRVEPANYKLAKGCAYYYINDKLKVVRAIDDDGKAATYRYLVGNYFHGPSEALKTVAKWSENRREDLAKDK